MQSPKFFVDICFMFFALKKIHLYPMNHQHVLVLQEWRNPISIPQKLQGLPFHHLKQPPKNRRNPKPSPRDKRYLSIFRVFIFPCNVRSLWWTAKKSWKHPIPRARAKEPHRFFCSQRWNRQKVGCSKRLDSFGKNMYIYIVILLMEEILHHLGCIKPWK